MDGLVTHLGLVGLSVVGWFACRTIERLDRTAEHIAARIGELEREVSEIAARFDEYRRTLN